MKEAIVRRLVTVGAFLALGSACGGGASANGGAGGAAGSAGTLSNGGMGGSGLATGGNGGTSAGHGGVGAGPAGTSGGGGAGQHDAGGSDAPSMGLVGTAGGTVNDPSGVIAIQIPPAALLGETTFAISAGAPPPPSPEYATVDGTSFRVAWSGAGFAASATMGVRIALPTVVAFDPGAGGNLAAYMNDTAGVVECPDGSTFKYANSSNQDGYYDDRVVPISCTRAGDGGGGSGGNGQLTISVVTVNSSARVTITAQPAPGLACHLGQDVDLTVGATGAAPLTYQWLRNGVPIDGATSSSYTGGIDAAADGTKYSVLVSNPYGSLTSDDATLSVLPPAPLPWVTPRPLGAASAAGVGAPAVASVGGYPIVVWNDGGTLRGASGSGAAPFSTIETLALPMRGVRPASRASGPVGRS